MQVLAEKKTTEGKRRQKRTSREEKGTLQKFKKAVK